MIARIKNFVLKICRIFPPLNKRLCLLLNNNTTSYWDSEYAADQADSKWASQIRLQFYDLAATALPKTRASILDIGSGLGFGGKHLMEICEGWRIEGLDFSSEASENAVIKTHCLDLRKDDLPGSYDYVLAVETLEHLPDSLSLLKKLYDAAKKAVVITVPYKGRISPTHPVSFDESCFNDYDDVDIKLEERMDDKGSVKTDMLVVIRKPA